MSLLVENVLMSKTISPIAPIFAIYNINNDSVQMDLDAFELLMYPNPSIEQQDVVTDFETYKPAEAEIDINKVSDSVVYELAKQRGGLSTALVES